MIFLDNASTTKINKQVNDLIYSTNELDFYNPSALYEPSIKVQEKIEEARLTIGNILNIEPQNIIFTSGATESNNTAIKGFITSNKNAEYIFSEGEHPSVYEVANQLKNLGYKVLFAKLNKSGTLDIDYFKSLLSSNTHFVSVMHVSNETGAINNIKELVALTKQVNPNSFFHCDGVQAVGKISVNIKDLGVDLYTLSSHKFHGPKGVGLLYVKNLNKFKPYILGGGQQQARRSGTENISGILATALALKLSNSNIQENYKNVENYRNIFIQKISKELSNFKINQAENNSPYILSVSFKNLKGEVILHMLEKYGILIGTGSACSSKKSNNRILQSMNVDKSYILGSIRISFSNDNTLEEINYASDKLIEVVKELSQKVA